MPRNTDPNVNQTPDTIELPDESPGVENPPVKTPGKGQKQNEHVPPVEVPGREDNPEPIPEKAD